MKHIKRKYLNRVGLLKFNKAKRRRLRKKSFRSGWFRYYFNVIHTAKRKGRTLTKTELPVFKIQKSQYLPNPLTPKYSENITFLAENKNAFSRKAVELPPDGIFEIPNPFSLTENYTESFLFLKKLFYALYNDKFVEITLDYKNCTRIDIDASVCMDTLLAEFIKFFKECRSKKINKKLRSILPINYDAEAVRKILFSIGAFKNIANVEIKFDDIIPFRLMIGNNYSVTKGRDKELEVTKMVDYIVECLTCMNRVLTWEAEDDLSKVIGEILINAAEHSGNRNRYSIGYFHESKNDNSHIGVFNLAIFAFGNTIYENFKKPESQNLEVVRRMKELSEKYTAKGFFKSKEFEEEPLWTLYALQEGVTSVKDKKRGNGSIHFIESFFQLKGNSLADKASFLTIISGNTRITFDGTYQICEKPRGKGNKVYKMMTLNASGNIEDTPDKEYIKFTENTFPGTLIVAKINITFNNIENS